MNVHSLFFRHPFIWLALLAVTASVAGLVTHHPVGPAAAQASDDHIATVEAAIAAFHAADVDTLEAIYAPDYVGHLAQSSEREALTRDDLTEMSQFLTTSLTGMAISTEAVVGDSSSDLAASRVVLSGTFTDEFYDYPPTGAPVEIEVQTLHRFNEAGQIVEEWFAYDNYWVMQQLGILEPAD